MFPISLTVTAIVIWLAILLLPVAALVIAVKYLNKKREIPEEEKPGQIERVDIRKSKDQSARVIQTARSKHDAEDGRRFKRVCLACGREFPDEFSGNCPDDGIEPSRIVDRLAAGSKFSEYYEIEGPLGTGGLSKVFKAIHLSSHKHVAIKLLHSHLCKDEISVQRFQREARSLSKLSHPNVVAVEDFMISPDGIPFIVMDLIEGESLQTKLKRENVMSWQDTVPIFIQICKGLSHAHSKGVIHRDLKPGNIMLMPTDNGALVKVVDFGLAKDETLDSIGALTSTGDVFGSPKYMSPEQCQGQKVDRRADVYAVGCLLYECLSGTAPFIGKNVLETLSMHTKSPIPQIPASKKVPDWLCKIVYKSLEKDLEKRFQSIDDLGGALQDGLMYSQKST